MLIVLAAVHSPTPDEIAQLPAALHHIEFRSFELARANPPLVRLIAAIPVWSAGYQSDWRWFDPAPGSRCEFYVGRSFLDANGERSLFLFTIARWACVPFGLLGGAVCWKWATDLYGPGAGLLALALWSFCPNALAAGSLITSDAACASLGAAAGYAYWKWLRAPSWTRSAITGVLLGLAELTKHIWLLVFALWPVLYLFSRVSGGGWNWRRQSFLEVVQLASIGSIAVLLMNAAYFFQGSCTPLGQFDFEWSALRGHVVEDSKLVAGPGNRFRGTVVGDVPIPLPKQFVLGVDTQVTAFERGRPAYLLGEWKYGGWWYYYLVGMAVKIPLGAWVLATLVCTLRASDEASRAHWRDELVMLAPAIAVLLFISVVGGINRHFRYVLPALPFIYIWLSSAVAVVSRRSLVARLVVGGAAGWLAASSLLVFPHSQSYFNELCGGPRGGPRVLLGSSVEWGQDLLFLKSWVDVHPEARPLFVAWHPGTAPPRIAGIACDAPPRIPYPGWYAVTLNQLYEPDSACAYLLDFKPVDRIAYSMNVYHLTEEDVRQWHANRKH